jgi:murein DD-endopeptidase MepM/ murein hydrolase activator NlpD
LAALAALAALALPACSAAPGAAAQAEAVPELPARDAPVPAEAALPAPQPAPEPAPVAEPAAPALACGGVLKQGGLVFCQAAPRARVRFGDITLVADAEGIVQYGLAQHAPKQLRVTSGSDTLLLDIAGRQDDFREVPGLDCDRVDARTPEQRAHAARSWEIKQAAFAAFHDGAGGLDGFAAPVASPRSSPFGPTRRYTGISKTSGEACDSLSVHRGLDFASPTGTPVRAPADGVITLADPDLYYEGGTIFLDHGHGLLSVFMHLSDVGVAPGDTVSRGDTIGKTGNTGRSTGPHLHWGVKWRNSWSRDRAQDFYIDPALLLELEP